jgi:hypothetical protein
LPYLNLVEPAKAQQQSTGIRTFQGASIDGKSLNTPRRR